jgi:hypothetical protein
MVHSNKAGIRRYLGDAGSLRAVNTLSGIEGGTKERSEFSLLNAPFCSSCADLSMFGRILSFLSSFIDSTNK